LGNKQLASTLSDEEGTLFLCLAHMLQIVPCSKHNMVEQQLVEPFLTAAFCCFKEPEILHVLTGGNNIGDPVTLGLRI
jgi:hypothetical protein